MLFRFPHPSVVIDRRRLLASGGASALLAAGGARPVAARQDGGTPAASQTDGAWSFTDDRPVTIDLPARPERIVAYLPLAAGLWDFGVRPIAVYGTTVRPDGTPEVHAGAVDLDAVTSLGEAYGEMDIEQLVLLEPDIVVNDLWFDEPDVWGLDASAVAQIETIAPIVHIGFVERPVSETIGRVEELAIALGADPEAPAVVAAKERFAQARTDLEAAIADKPGLRVIFLGGTTDALWIGNPEQMGDLAFFRDLGLDVVQPDTDELWHELSWEQANTYPADLVMLDVRATSATPEALAAIPTWSNLPAVAAGQVRPWQIEFVPSWSAFADVLEAFTVAVREADPTIVED